MGAYSLSQLFTWFHAAYRVHTDLNSHTSGGMPFGYGMVHFKSSKQKLKTKCSNEAELVGVSDYLTYNISGFVHENSRICHYTE